MKRQSPCRTHPHGICHAWTIVPNELGHRGALGYIPTLPTKTTKTTKINFGPFSRFDPRGSASPPMTKMTKMIKNRFLGILGILIIGVEPYMAFGGRVERIVQDMTKERMGSDLRRALNMPILGRCPHQDLSGRRYGASPGSVEKWERSACPSVCGMNKTHPPPVHVPIRQQLQR